MYWYKNSSITSFALFPCALIENIFFTWFGKITYVYPVLYSSLYLLYSFRLSKNITFGVFKDKSAEISYYLKSGTNLSYKTYENIKELYKALDNN